MLNKTRESLFNILFNVPQNAVMTVALSHFQGITAPTALLQTYVCAYCAGTMLSYVLKLPAVGAAAVRWLHAEKRPAASYLVSNLACGLFMGVIMNFLITWMCMGPVSGFFAAYFHTLPMALLISAVSNCLWAWPVDQLAERWQEK